jgi:O-antigen ligase
MTDFLKRNIQFVVMLLVWVVCGFINSYVAYVAVGLSVILLKRRNMYAELIVGFIFILILSDSRQYQLDFAKTIKTIYLLLLTLFILFDRKQFKYKNTFFLPFVPFLLWSVVTVFNAPQFTLAAQKTLSYGLLYFVAPTYFIKAFHEYGKSFLKDFTWLITILLLVGLLLIVIAPGFVYLAGRFTGIFGNPNGLGIFCTVFFILFSCIQIKFNGLYSRNELIFIYSVLMLAVVLTGSRNTLMSIFIFLLFTKFYKVSYWYGFIAVIGAGFIYQTVLSNLPSILEAFGLAEALRADTLESGSGRLVAWIFAWKNINSSLMQFFIGGGFSYDEFVFFINKDALSALGHQGGVHNTFLALWLNTGIIGLILWLTGFFRATFKAIPVTYTALPMMYAVIFSASFEAWLMGSLNPFNIIFLFILALVTTPNDFFADGLTDSQSETEPLSINTIKN